MDDFSPDALDFQAQFKEAFTGAAGFFYPYHLTSSDGARFWGNVWTADVRGSAYAHAVATVPELAQADVRFLTVRPADPFPAEGATIPHDGGTLTLHFWAQLDPISGESIAACSWSL